MIASFFHNLNVVPGRGLEPPRVSPHGPKPCASANFATLAFEHKFIIQNLQRNGKIVC